jgi:hypothetical protein
MVKIQRKEGVDMKNTTITLVVVLMGLLAVNFMVQPAWGALNNGFNTDHIYAARGDTSGPGWNWESHIRKLDELQLDATPPVSCPKVYPTDPVYNMDAGAFGTWAYDTYPKAICTKLRWGGGWWQDKGKCDKSFCFSNSPVPGQHTPAGARLFGIYEVSAPSYGGLEWNWTSDHPASFQIVEFNSDGKRIRVMQVGNAAGLYAPDPAEFPLGPEHYEACTWENTNPDSLLAPCAWGPNDGEWTRHNVDGCRTGTIRYNPAKNTLCVSAIIGEFGIETEFVPDELKTEDDEPAYPRVRVYEFALPDWPEVYWETVNDVPDWVYNKADMVGQPIPQSDPSVVKLIQIYEVARPHSAGANNGRFENKGFRPGMTIDNNQPGWGLYNGINRWMRDGANPPDGQGDVVKCSTLGKIDGRNRYYITDQVVDQPTQTSIPHPHFWSGAGIAVRKNYDQLCQVPHNDCGCIFTHVFDTTTTEPGYPSELKLLAKLSGNLIMPDGINCYTSPPGPCFIFGTPTKTSYSQYDEVSGRVYFASFRKTCGDVLNLMCLQNTAPPNYTVIGDVGYRLTITTDGAGQPGGVPGELSDTMDACSPPAPPGPEPTGACCTGSNCQEVLLSQCDPQNWMGAGTVCGQYPCPGEGACCTPCTGTCRHAFEQDCTSPEVWQGMGTICQEDICMGVCGDPSMDGDCDGDVDQDDFAKFQRCYSGDGTNYPAGLNCVCFDKGSDSPDGDIDSLDFDAFQICASGPNVPADVCCDGGPGCP